MTKITEEIKTKILDDPILNNWEDDQKATWLVDKVENFERYLSTEHKLGEKYQEFLADEELEDIQNPQPNSGLQKAIQAFRSNGVKSILIELINYEEKRRKNQTDNIYQTIKDIKGEVELGHFAPRDYSPTSSSASAGITQSMVGVKGLKMRGDFKPQRGEKVITEKEEIEVVSTESQLEITQTIKKSIKGKLLSNEETKGFEETIKNKLNNKNDIKKIIVFLIPQLGQEEKVQVLVLRKNRNEYSLELVRYDKNTSSLEVNNLLIKGKAASNKEDATKEAVNIELSKQTNYLKGLLKKNGSEEILKHEKKNKLGNELENVSLKLLVMNYRLDYIKNMESDKERETDTNKCLAKAYESEFNTLKNEHINKTISNSDCQELQEYVASIEQSPLTGSAFGIDIATTAATVTGVFVKTFVQVIDPGIGDIIGGIGKILNSLPSKK